MKEELFITVEGFKKFCEYFDIKINEKDIEIIKKYFGFTDKEAKKLYEISK